MAPQWEIEYGMGMGMPAGFGAAASPAYMYGMSSAAETLRVDDLLDFTNHDLFLPSSSSSWVAADANLLPAAQLTAPAAFNSEHHCPGHDSFADDIYMPSDEVAELEWLSKFVEDSFSDVPLQSLTAETMVLNGNIHQADVSSVGRGPRSKRSRGVSVPAETGCVRQTNASAWTSLALSSSTTSSSSSSDFPTPNGSFRRKQAAVEAGDDGGMRRCTHCQSEKTPQWRTGPLGPKTLCNACGVRFKSGRLVPEYRPAASPTFVLTQHSNSHRKVVELRRQKELLILRHHDNAASSAAFAGVTAAARPEMIFHDYDVC